MKSHLTASSEPEKRICCEETNSYIYLEKDQKILPDSEQRTDQYQLNETMDYFKQ